MVRGARVVAPCRLCQRGSAAATTSNKKAPGNAGAWLP
jgi:hypothetical protein